MFNRKEYMKKYNSDNKKHLSEYHKNWYLRNKKHIREQQKRYNQTDSGKASRKKYDKHYYDEHKKECISKVIAYHQTSIGKLNHCKGQRKYLQTKKGKMQDAKHLAKRKRNLGWIQMFPNPFDESVLIDWHHITDSYVVALPRDLHKLYYGKFHREKTMGIVKQIYLK